MAHEEIFAESYGTEDEPAYHIKRGDETLADVLWHVEENQDPDMPEHGGYWVLALADGTEHEWREVPKEPHDEAIERAIDFVSR